MKIKVWGARGSIPTPLDPREIEEKICQAIFGMTEVDTNNLEAIRAHVAQLPPLIRRTVGGNTSCVEIRAGGQTFIIDAGTGIRRLGLELLKGPCGQGQGTLYFFFSHPHWDHIQGFPFFAPAYIPGNRLVIYSLHDIRAALTDQQRFSNFPVPLSYMRAQLEFIRLEVGRPFDIGPVTINTICNNHPGDAFSYRFEDQHSSFVYASDAEYKHLDEASLQKHLDFFKEADALIFDAQYGLREAWEDKADWGHSSAMIGVDLARQAGVKRLLLFHHEPTYGDGQLQAIEKTAIEYQLQEAILPPYEVMIAYEGLELDLTPAGAIDVQLMAERDAAILTPSSIFDEQGVEQLTRYLADQQSQLESILDLSQVEHLTTASLKALVTLSQQREDGPLVLAAPSAAVIQMIKLAGYGDYFAIYPTVLEAVRAVQAREALNLPGQIINKQYQITEKLGEGRLGVALKVTDLEQERVAALRIFSPSFGVETIDHFASQVHLLLEMDHRHIAQVYDCDWSQEGNYTFIVEELLNGPTLQEYLAGREEPLPLDEAMELALALALALEYAHSRDVIHGNLKPQDIFLTPQGIKIRGFGLGRLEEGRNLLEAPMLFLTVTHLAPEQILGEPLDSRVDLYALGVILYQLFTGRLPFTGSEQELLQAHLTQNPIPPRQLNPQLSYPVEHLILKLMAKNPSSRYASAQQARRISSSLTSSSGESHQPDQRLLVGRDSHLQTLQRCWGEAKSGHGRLVFITGEAGIGKSSLAQHLALQIKDGIVLASQCQARAGSPAYHLFSQPLEAYLTSVPPESFDEEARQLLRNFIRLVPELSQMVPHLSEPPPLDPQQEQLRLMSSLAQFIKHVTPLRPWVLILDDLQWIDPGSLALLQYLGDQLSELALFIVGIYRDTDVERDQTLQTALLDFPLLDQLSLERLTQAEVAQLLRQLWDNTVPERLIQKIYQQTGGNPLYIQEVARGLEEEGLVTLYAGLWHFPVVETIRLPQSVYEAVEGRIHYLSADARDVLVQAAILGQTFWFTDLVAISSLSEWAVLDHLDLALERQLVQEISGDDMLRFSHPEIHHTVYHDLGPLRRRRLHRRAGEALEQRAQPQPERLAEQLAYHFTEAREWEKALVYSLQAAHRAKEAYANELAIYWYRQVLTILDELDWERQNTFQELRLSVCHFLSELLQLAGRWPEAQEFSRLALALARPANNPENED